MRIMGTVLVTCLLAGAAQARPVDSAASYGYRGDDAAKYDRLVRQNAKLGCKALAQEYGKARKIAGRQEKGTGLQIAGALLGRSKAGVAAGIGGDVVKDAALRRDAAQAVYSAKGCRK